MIRIIGYILIAMVPLGAMLYGSWRKMKEDERLRDRKRRNVTGRMTRPRR